MILLKYALALEGGGARGAYHMGAIKALYELGYNFDAVSGTSIGSINGAMIAQGDFDTAYEIWKNMKYSTIFDIDDEKVNSVRNSGINLDIIKYISKKLSATLKNHGIDTKKMRKLLEENIDEEKIRNSNMLYGLVTVCLTDRKPQELFINDIPKGKLIDYIMASSCLPIFKTAKIDNKNYLDGGFWDNCPVDMLLHKGYKDIFVIRVYKIMRIRNYKKIIKQKGVTLHMIEPVDRLPSILSFESKTANELIDMGYYDAIKSTKNLDGIRYYIESKNESYYFDKICNFREEKIKKIAELLKIQIAKEESYKKIWIEEILPELVYKTQVKEANNYKEVVFSLVEYIAIKENINRYQIYDFEELLELVKKKIIYKDKNRIEEAIYRFVKYI